MLTIRSSQLRAFEEASMRELSARFSRELAMDGTRLQGLLMRLRTRYGIVLVSDLVRLAALARDLGCDFDEHPENHWVQEFLDDPSVVSTSRRVTRVCAEMERRRAVSQRNATIEAQFRRASVPAASGEPPEEA